MKFLDSLNFSTRCCW